MRGKGSIGIESATALVLRVLLYSDFNPISILISRESTYLDTQ
jgi:hypothetical protein